MKESERKEFVRRWKSHANDFNILRLTPSMELSEEIGKTIKHLDDLIERVAEDKIQASKRKKLKKVV